MHKTFTDCYMAEGFTGGSWAYALNSNDAKGDIVDSSDLEVMAEDKRRLAFYPLGWKSLEVRRRSLL
jgi:hypothetical protein